MIEFDNVNTKRSFGADQVTLQGDLWWVRRCVPLVNQVRKTFLLSFDLNKTTVLRVVQKVQVVSYVLDELLFRSGALALAVALASKMMPGNLPSDNCACDCKRPECCPLSVVRHRLVSTANQKFKALVSAAQCRHSTRPLRCTSH